MKPLPDTEDISLVLRTDFSDDAAWQGVCEAIQTPVGEFSAYVELIDDPDFADCDVVTLLSLPKESLNHSFLFLVDHETISSDEFPILCVDLRRNPGSTFRVIPSAMWSVENNLSIANMDFREFAESTDPDGVFRGFPQ